MTIRAVADRNGTIDIATMAVMANRLDSIVREMTSTILRTARSTTMAARDFSCCLVTSGHELISSPEGIPVHVYGMGPSSADMAELQPEFREGDAFLHNDPYLGNSHAGDHQILVPVFFAGEHVFTAGVKAHQIDVGNSLPSTYMPAARDVYEEGALIFPCVRIQDGYKDVQDIIRMCQRRIRTADIWYGDYLAQLGAARLAESRLHEFCAKYGLDAVRAFIRDYLAYSERITADAIRRLPGGRIEGRTMCDPFPGAPDGVPLKAIIDVDATAGRVAVDLRDNPDCLPNGFNLTKSTATNAAIAGVLTVLASSRAPDAPIIPNNAGSFRCIDVLLRENCVVGIPHHPTCCSVATNTIADRVLGMIPATFARLGGGIGLAEPCFGSPPFMAVVFGHDRGRGADYVLQLVIGASGGPGSRDADGWLTFLLAGGAGVAYINSAENVEQKYPIVIWDRSIRIDSEGAGRRRGAPGNICIYGPRFDPMHAGYFLEGVVNPPQGVVGGGTAQAPDVWLVHEDGAWTHRDDGFDGTPIGAGQAIVSLSAGGGGYGRALDREPEHVLEDVIEGWISPERARDVYGVVLRGNVDKWETLSVNMEATAEERTRRRDAGAEEYRAPAPELNWWVGNQPARTKGLIQ